MATVPESYSAIVGGVLGGGHSVQAASWSARAARSSLTRRIWSLTRRSVAEKSSWPSRAFGLAAEQIFALVIDPSNPQTVYAGTRGGRASNFLNRVAQSGKQIVFVGTKRQAKNLVQQEAPQTLRDDYFEKQQLSIQAGQDILEHKLETGV